MKHEFQSPLSMKVVEQYHHELENDPLTLEPSVSQFPKSSKLVSKMFDMKKVSTPFNSPSMLHVLLNKKMKI